MAVLTPLSEIKKKIGNVELVAVSKTKPVSDILVLYRQGQRVFGENYVQELVEKKSEFDRLGITDLEFHFIGHLQSNKVKRVLPCVTTVHSVDSIKLYEEIAKRAESLSKKVSVYFQVNIDEESSKSGFTSGDLANLSAVIRSRPSSFVKPQGLMTIPDPDKNAADAFERMRDLSKLYGETLGHGLSMGMSGDFEIAIAKGATSVRIGSALFGARK